MINFSVVKFIKDCPNDPGVYVMYDIQSTVIYVGKAKRLKNRLTSYLKVDDKSYKSKGISKYTEKIEITVTRNEAESFLLEANLIKKYKPKYNILLRDDKSFPYISLSKSAFPRIQKYRGKVNNESYLFGPFPSSHKVDETLLMLQRTFQLRSCTDQYFNSRKRPCLLYQIKRCSAPCVKKINKENYSLLVDQVRELLSGKVDKLKKEINDAMQSASKEMEFETAAIYRDRLKSLNIVQSKQFITQNGIADADIISAQISRELCVINILFIRCGYHLGSKNYILKVFDDSNISKVVENFIGNFYQKNVPPSKIYVSSLPNDHHVIEEALLDLHKVKVQITSPKKGRVKALLNHSNENGLIHLEQNLDKKNYYAQILQDLERLFNTRLPIRTIEVYDNSHIMGKNSVGGKIVWSDGEFQKSQYRKYNLHNMVDTGGDDYEMLRQVMNRRLSKGKDLGNFFIIDGGKGHLSTIQSLLKELEIDIDFICVSKGVDRNSGNETIYDKHGEAYYLEKRSDVKMFIQILRDEAHRYAIASHRIKRSKSLLSTKVDMIKGVGAKRRKALMSYFGSVSNIESASIEEISKVEFIDQKTAEKIYKFFHN